MSVNVFNGKYEQIKLLGEGSFGKAYLVESIETKTLYVIKTIELGAMSEEDKQEAITESRIHEKLNHPNIIKFKEVFLEKKTRLNIVMDYADGGDLQAKIKLHNKDSNNFLESQILDWFTQTCLAIKHIHDRKILHRDIKSQNIFLTKNGLVKLGDFGIAKCLDKTMDKISTIVGTPYYLSPELISNKPYSFKNDIWSLGVVLYEMCSLKVPFEAQNLPLLSLKIVKGQYNPIPKIYSKDLHILVANCLNVDPNKRPSIKEILKSTLIKNRINKFLNEIEFTDEFSHTIMHNMNILKNPSFTDYSIAQNEKKKDLGLINKSVQKPIIKKEVEKPNREPKRNINNYDVKESQGHNISIAPVNNIEKVTYQVVTTNPNNNPIYSHNKKVSDKKVEKQLDKKNSKGNFNNNIDSDNNTNKKKKLVPSSSKIVDIKPKTTERGSINKKDDKNALKRSDSRGSGTEDEKNKGEFSKFLKEINVKLNKGQNRILNNNEVMSIINQGNLNFICKDKDVSSREDTSIRPQNIISNRQSFETAITEKDEIKDKKAVLCKKQSSNVSSNEINNNNINTKDINIKEGISQYSVMISESNYQPNAFKNNMSKPSLKEQQNAIEISKPNPNPNLNENNEYYEALKMCLIMKNIENEIEKDEESDEEVFEPIENEKIIEEYSDLFDQLGEKKEWETYKIDYDEYKELLIKDLGEEVYNLVYDYLTEEINLDSENFICFDYEEFSKKLMTNILAKTQNCLASEKVIKIIPDVYSLILSEKNRIS